MCCAARYRRALRSCFLAGLSVIAFCAGGAVLAPVSDGATHAFPAPADGPYFAGAGVVWASVLPERSWAVRLFSAARIGDRTTKGAFIANPAGDDYVRPVLGVTRSRVILTVGGYRSFLEAFAGFERGPLTTLYACFPLTSEAGPDPAAIAGDWALVPTPSCSASATSATAVYLDDLASGQRRLIDGAQTPVAAAGRVAAWVRPGAIIVARLPALTPIYQVDTQGIGTHGQGAPSVLRVDASGDVVAAWGALAYSASPADPVLRPLPRALINEDYGLANGHVVSWTPGMAGVHTEAAIAVGDLHGHARVLVRVRGIRGFGLQRIAGGVDTDGKRIVWAQPTCQGAVIRTRSLTATALLIRQHECPLALRRAPVLDRSDAPAGPVAVNIGVICDDASMQPCGVITISTNGRTLAQSDDSTPAGVTLAFPTRHGAYLFMHTRRLRVRLTVNRSAYPAADRRAHARSTTTYMTVTPAARAFLRTHLCEVIVCRPRSRR
jgi:hypothetical protein